MGSGKSALARELSFELGLALERSDQVRKSMPVPEAPRGAPPAAYDQGIYSTSYNQAVYGELLQRARQALQRGKGIVIDATFRRRSDRDLFRALAAELQAPFFLIETRCPERVIRERLLRRRHDPGEISDGRWEIFPMQKAEFEETLPGEAIVVNSALPLKAELDQALKGMGLLP